MSQYRALLVNYKKTAYLRPHISDRMRSLIGNSDQLQSLIVVADYLVAGWTPATDNSDRLISDRYLRPIIATDLSAIVISDRMRSLIAKNN
ncbi:hypothetical protein MRB53_026257 [Persea americana]|uniref:Uncharacterized protein n=1 Tax=Persea americana TaxID=3435 RepID=A0ACC2LHN2_PERAE|nr:hypothetical protein MRB53_026257 [Persea americana]